MKTAVNVLYQCANRLCCVTFRTHIYSTGKFRNYSTTIQIFCVYSVITRINTKNGQKSFFMEFPAKSNCRLALAKLENKLKQQQLSVYVRRASGKNIHSFTRRSRFFSTARRSLSCHVYCYFCCLHLFFSTLCTQQRSQVDLWLLFMCLLYLVYFSNL